MKSSYKWQRKLANRYSYHVSHMQIHGHRIGKFWKIISSIFLFFTFEIRFVPHFNDKKQSPSIKFLKPNCNRRKPEKNRDWHANVINMIDISAGKKCMIQSFFIKKPQNPEIFPWNEKSYFVHMINCNQHSFIFQMYYFINLSLNGRKNLEINLIRESDPSI